MKRRNDFNPKRRIRASVDAAFIARLIESIRYSGNPEHKRNPGDYGLTPPQQPRLDKTLCDDVNISSRSEAEKLLKAGVKNKLISAQERNGFPQNIWAVTDGGRPLEAQLENQGNGTYHGYPMAKSDPFHDEVLARWKEL